MIISFLSLNKETKKEELFEKLTRRLSLNKNKLITPEVNYREIEIEIKDRKINMINLPSIDFLIFIKKNKDPIDNEKEKIINKFLNSSDILILLLDHKNNKDEIIFILKFLGKINLDNKKNRLSSTILIIDDINEKKYDDYYKKNQLLMQKLIKITDSHYYFSFLLNNNFSLLIKKIINWENIDKSFIKDNIIEEKKNNKDIPISIIGPPNTGKSTLMNTLLKKERSIVTSIKGTTKEEVIGYIKIEKKVFEITDTSGISEKKFANLENLKNSGIILFVIDSEKQFTKKIMGILNLVESLKKNSIIVINKCDLINKKKSIEIENEFRDKMKSIKHFPIISLSALKKISTNKLIKIIKEIFVQSEKDFSKSLINSTIKDIINENPPKFWNGGKVKIYFTKHEKGWEHYFIIFVNNPKFIHFSYERFIINQIRKKLKLKDIQIKLFFKKSK